MKMKTDEVKMRVIKFINNTIEFTFSFLCVILITEVIYEIISKWRSKESKITTLKLKKYNPDYKLIVVFGFRDMKLQEKYFNEIYDNVKANFTNKVESPDTEPIKKTDIQPQTEKPVSVPQKPQITTEPVTKSDVEGENNAQNNKLTNSFKNMMDRMDNLYNDEEENK